MVRSHKRWNIHENDREEPKKCYGANHCGRPASRFRDRISSGIRFHWLTSKEWRRRGQHPKKSDGFNGVAISALLGFLILCWNDWRLAVPACLETTRNHLTTSRACSFCLWNVLGLLQMIANQISCCDEVYVVENAQRREIVRDRYSSHRGNVLILHEGGYTRIF